MTDRERPRILLVTRNLPPLVGGMERLNWHMAAELAKVAEVRIIGPDGSAAEAPTGLMVREAPLKPLWKFLWRARALACREAAAWKPAIVLAGSGLTAPLARAAARKCGASYAVYVHGLDVAVRNRIYRALWLPAIRGAGRVIANSSATAGLCRTIGVDAARIGIVHPGVDLPATSPGAARGALPEGEGARFGPISHREMGPRESPEDGPLSRRERARREGPKDEPLSPRERGRGEGPDLRHTTSTADATSDQSDLPEPPSGAAPHPLSSGEDAGLELLSDRMRDGPKDKPLSHRERGRGEGPDLRHTTSTADATSGQSDLPEPSSGAAPHPRPSGGGPESEPRSDRRREGPKDKHLSPREGGRREGPKDKPLSPRERGRGEGPDLRHPTPTADATSDQSDLPEPPFGAAPHPLPEERGASGTFRSRHNLGNRPLLLSVGRLSTRKGLLQFVSQALPRIVAARPDAMLLVVGDAPTQALHAEAQTPERIQAAADAAGVGDRLKFLGVITDYAELGEIYRAADIHVFPVREIPGDPEGFGMVAVEAAAHGLPTVAFATGGVVDSVAEGRSGRLVAPRNYAAFADAVIAMLARRGSMRTPCLDFARGFAWPEFGRQVAMQLHVRRPGAG